MRIIHSFAGRSFVKLLALALLGNLGTFHGPVHAAETARVVKYGQDDIVTVHTKLRYSTLIVLPENEEILDFTTGDKDFWIINGAHNLCYVHPAQSGIRGNLNLVTASGPEYLSGLDAGGSAQRKNRRQRAAWRMKRVTSGLPTAHEGIT